MDDKQFQQVKKQLDLIMKLLALDKLSGKTFTEQVTVLTDFGFHPSDIATLLNRKTNEVTAICNYIRSKTRRRGEKK